MGISSFLIVVLVLLINQSVAQNYIPKPPPMTSCPSGYTYQSIGSNDVSSLGTFPATSQTVANYIMTTLFNGTTGLIVSQLSFGITDNTAIASSISLRLALFKVTLENTASPQMLMLSQTPEIQLFSTSPDVIYGNLLNNVTLQAGLYAMGVWSNIAIRTGVAPTLPTIKNVPYVYYSGVPLSSSIAANSYTYGFRALQLHGCVSSTNAFTDPTNRLINFCAYLQSTTPVQEATTYQYQYTGRTVTQSIGGVLAVSTTDIGTSTQGNWQRVKAGYATLVTQSSSENYYQSMSQQSESVIVTGQSINQFYPDLNGPRVDGQGLSFSSGNGVQLLISYTNNTYQLTRIRSGVAETFNAIVSGFVTSDQSINQCSPPSSYTPDSFSCPVDSLPIQFGDSDLTRAASLYSTATTYVYANWLYTRQFTAWTPNTSINQLSLAVLDNVGVVAKLRMAVFSAEVGAANPALTLIGQTREIELRNVNRQTLRINLLNPISLEQGRNYTIAFMLDQSIYAPYGYWANNPTYYNLGYLRFMSQNGQIGFPSTVMTMSTGQVTAMGASGCARQQTTRRMSFCAAFVYASYSTTYSGVLDVLSTSQTSDLGSYYTVIGGSGSYNQTYTTGTTLPRNLNWTINNYNHPANWRLYHQPITVGRHLDTNGIAMIVHFTTGFSGGLSTFWDPVSASWEFIERQQTMSSTGVSNVAMLISEMSIGDYNGGVLPTCLPPPKPINTVSPASVARVVCPNNENSISEVFGDASVGSWELSADGTTIEANRIYTNRFVATSTATVRQFAIGILRNTNQPLPISVRLGLYSAATNQLLGQASQLALNQAVDQLIIMTLATSVIVTSGQTYYIALIANNPLEVATSSAPNSPSMLSTFSTTGLPTAFVPGANAVSVSIAIYTCATSTHSFCAYYQYYDQSMGRSLSYFYQGLLQSAGTATDGYGTYTTVYAASGRLTQYSRLTNVINSVVTVYTFYQQPNDEAKLYTQSTNGRALNSQGIRLMMSTGAESIVNFNVSNNMMDESFQSSNLDVNLRYSQFTFNELSPNTPLATCSLGVVPTNLPVSPPQITCPTDQKSLIHGSADSEDLAYPRESYAVSANMAVFNTIVSGNAATMVQQLKIGISQNRNFINRIRLGLYTANFSFLGTTETIQITNPSYSILTGTLTVPQYLAPNSVYYVGVWSENAMSTGYGSSQARSFTMSFNQQNGWPRQLDGSNAGYNNERALAAHGCTTPIRVSPVISSSTAGPIPSSSSTGQSSSSSSRSSSSTSVVSSSSTITSSSSTGTVVEPETTSASSDGLSKGAVAGIVIGVVLGTNMLLLACLWLFCFGCGAASSKRGSADQEIEPSRVD